MIFGNDQAEEQPMRYGYSPSSGYTTTRTWRCATSAPLDAIAATLSGWQWEITKGFAVHTLTATLAALDTGSGGGGAEVPLTTWELLPNRLEKDITESTIINVKGIGKTELGVIEAALENNDTTDYDSFSDNGKELFLLMRRGVKSQIVNQPTIHRSEIVSSAYAVKASLANVGSIISTTTLSGSENIPTSILFNLPNYVDPAGVANEEPVLRWGWYKNYPTVQQVSFNKFQISTTWEYGLWAVFLYGNPL